MGTLNELESAEVLVHCSKNSTTVKISAGLHPADSDRLLDEVIKFLATCEKSKKHIKDFNKEAWEHLKH